MRYWVIGWLLLLAACTTNQELAPTDTSPVTATDSGPAEPNSTVAATSTVAPGTTSPAPIGSLAYELIAELSIPVQVTARPGDEVSYVITQGGLMRAMVGGEVLSDPVLDISNRVANGFEQGLLSIALHPTEDLFYLHYSAPDGDTVVSEFRLATPTEASVDSERVLLQLDQPAPNHNGGMLLFHPEDGRLLVGLGDGGGSGDRFGNGQNAETLLGGMVALDTEGDPDPVLYSMGLRNPWRFWIDGSLLYIADVGQSAFEEVSVADLVPNQNFGWPIAEGLHCFRPSSGCDVSGTVLPVLEVAHGDGGTCSITGGVVYRGAEIPELKGHYVYSDYCGGYLRSFRFNGPGEPLSEADWTEQVGVPGRVTGFGVDGSGELYVTTTERLLKVVASP